MYKSRSQTKGFAIENPNQNKCSTLKVEQGRIGNGRNGRVNVNRQRLYGPLLHVCIRFLCSKILRANHDPGIISPRGKSNQTSSIVYISSLIDDCNTTLWRSELWKVSLTHYLERCIEKEKLQNFSTIWQAIIWSWKKNVVGDGKKFLWKISNYDF